MYLYPYAIVYSNRPRPVNNVDSVTRISFLLNFTASESGVRTAKVSVATGQERLNQHYITHNVKLHSVGVLLHLLLNVSTAPPGY